MNEHELRARLLSAEPNAANATAPVGFGEHVRVLSARRKRRRTVLAAGIAGCFALGAFAALRPNREAPALTVRPVEEAPEVQLAKLRRAADDAQRVADAIRARRKSLEIEAAAERSSAVPDPLFEIELQIETTAARRFAEGERAARAGDLRGAAHSFERVVALFPNSRASALAQERLADLKIN